jgi:hypothetical protein
MDWMRHAVDEARFALARGTRLGRDIAFARGGADARHGLIFPTGAAKRCSRAT